MSKQINVKRVLKTLAIVIPCLILLIFVFASYSESFRSLLMYCSITDKKEEQGASLKTRMQNDNFAQYDEITESFGIDEYVFDWEGDLRYEDFLRVYPYIDKPTKYFVEENIAWEGDWTLKNGYVLTVFCEKFESEQIVPGMYNSCSLTYNEQEIGRNVRYWVFCPDDGKGCEGKLNFQVLSPDNEDYEFLILGEYAQGSYDYAYVYSLQDGQAKSIPFRENGEEKKSWFVNYPINLRLFEKEEDFKLITIYQNPSPAELYIYHVWDILDDSLVLEKTVGHFWEDFWDEG